MNRLLVCAPCVFAAGILALGGLPAAAADPPAAPVSPCWSELFHELGPQWNAPTQHQSLDLTQLLSGAGCVFIARPADLWAHPEGEKLRTAEPLASLVQALDAQVQELTSVGLAAVEQIIVGLPSDPEQGYDLSLVVRLKKAVDPAALRKHWRIPVEWEHAGYTFLATSRRLYFIPPGKGGKQVGIALGVKDRTAIFRELAGAQRGVFRRELESLLTVADGNRHLSVAFTPSYLLGTGRSLLAGPVAPVARELKSLTVVDDVKRGIVKAMLLSVHAGEEYVHAELRVEAGNALPPSLFAHLLYERLAAIPPRVRAEFEAHSAAFGRSPARDVLARFPLMLSALGGYTRAGVQGRQAILTSALPPEAAHNLALGAAWALTTELPPSVSAKAPLTFAQRLSRRGDFKSQPEAIDRLFSQLREHLGLEIDMIGQDLEVLGITKSRRMVIDLKDATAADILTEFARVLNPGDVKHVSSPDQRVVWVIDDSRGPGKERVLFTSRERADRWGKVPAEFSIMNGER